jgi:hypothetical protein
MVGVVTLLAVVLKKVLVCWSIRAICGTVVR